MSTETVHRHANWVIRPEPAPEAPSAVYEVECTTCLHSSGAADSAEAAYGWAARHADGLPRHTGFREIVHRFWRAFPAA
ncbi:hypothetical protein [Streptomyces sp. NPDC048845]|uniref:DUF7848 domain-containing protein n=1 Tax=Streptomyces sp. NPDC048845 TaxID=3155390 RepID=UPI00343C6AFF